VDADAIEHLWMTNDFKAGLPFRTAIEACVNFKEARDGAKAGNYQLFASDDGARSAEIGIDGEMRGGVVRSLVLKQGLLQQCIDAVALPIHGFPAENSSQFLVHSSQFPEVSSSAER
jgi:hypothetical protein